MELILHSSTHVYGVHRVNFVSNRTKYVVTWTEQVSFYRFDCLSFGILLFLFPYCFFFLCSPCHPLFSQPTAYLITYASTHFRFVLTLTEKQPAMRQKNWRSSRAMDLEFCFVVYSVSALLCVDGPTSGKRAFRPTDHYLNYF